MNQYVTGTTIRRLREKLKITQSDLAEVLNVSDKAVSKWETGRGYPDITLLEPISKALGISTIELLSGNDIINTNRASNILKSKLFICPICGNIIHATGEAVISCCGIVLPPLESEATDKEHLIRIEIIEDEYYVCVNHEMTKNHYISFLAYLSGDTFDLVKLYPEGNAETRFKIHGSGVLHFYCNRHGLFGQKI